MSTTDEIPGRIAYINARIIDPATDTDMPGYLFTDGDKTQQGSWRIGPTSLILSPDNEESFECDLRLFDTGKIGIDGPGHQRKIYMKRADNVVVLRQGPSSD